MDEIVVFVTTASKAEAETMATSLVEQGLAACANILPQVSSIFLWEGKICRENETLMLLKSRKSVFKKLAAAVKKQHSYSVPEIIALPIIDGSPDYLTWLRKNIQ